MRKKIQVKKSEGEERERRRPWRRNTERRKGGEMRQEGRKREARR